MIKSELVAALCAEYPELGGEANRAIIDLFFETITDRLASGGRVEIRGFGSFSTRARKERTGRNPRNGADVAVVAKRKVHFKPGKDIRLRLLEKAAETPDRSEELSPPDERLSPIAARSVP